MCSKHPDNQSDVKSDQMKKNQKIIELLDEWLADESDYDERVWPTVKNEIEENRLSSRKRFSESTNGE